MENNKLRQRFVKDYNLPINVFDEKIFNYYSNLYDFFPKDKWENLKTMIDEKYDGNVEKWLEYCASVRDNAIYGVIETDKYKEFNNCDLSQYKVSSVVGEHSCYTNETDGCLFVSIDLKKANFQALKYVGVLDDEDYDHFIEKYDGDDYIKGSKYLRQVIFGKMNPGRTITVEKYIMGKIMPIADEILPFDFKLYLYSQNSDELVYKQSDTWIYPDKLKEFCEKIEERVLNELNIEVRAEYIKVTKLPIVNINGNNVDAFVRENLITNEKVLKKASTTFYPQIYKLWKNLAIEDNDLIFYFEDQLAHFNNKLIKINNGNK